MKKQLFYLLFLCAFPIMGAFAQDTVVSSTGRRVSVNNPAASSTLGLIQLSGDLSGTAATPTITSNAVLNKTLTGFSTSISGTIGTSDTILQAFGKLEATKTSRGDVLATVLDGLNTTTSGTIAATNTVLQAFGRLEATKATINSPLTGLITSATGTIGASDSILQAFGKLEATKATINSALTGINVVATGTIGATDTILGAIGKLEATKAARGDVLTTQLTNLNSVITGTIASTDTVLGAFGKLQATKVAINGDLGGTATATTVVGLGGRAISGTTFTDGQLLQFDNASSRWVPRQVFQKIDSFTPTANQLTFTLTEAPTGGSSTDVAMYINGVLIDKAAVSLNASTRVITYAPSNNSSFALSATDRVYFIYSYIK